MHALFFIRFNLALRELLAAIFLPILLIKPEAISIQNPILLDDRLFELVIAFNVDMTLPTNPIRIS
jgi:hypothetical protein